MPPPLLSPSDKEMSWMPGELQVGFRQQKHFQVKLHLMLAWVPLLIGTGQRCHCRHPPSLCVPTTAPGRCGQAPMDRQLLHDFPSSKYYHQNATPPSALRAVLVCDGISVPRAWCHLPGSKPAGGLGKEEKLPPAQESPCDPGPCQDSPLLWFTLWRSREPSKQHCQHLGNWGGWQLSINVNTSERDPTERCTRARVVGA